MVLLDELLAGSCAGLVQDALLHPIDTLRARLDVTTTTKRANPLASMLHEASAVVRQDGFSGLYRGYTLCMVGSAPANALYFSSYQVWKRILTPATTSAAPASSPLRDAASGLGAELIAALLWTPLDVVKQRLQVAPAELGTLSAARAATATAGLAGLWRGYWAGICVWGPFSSSYFATYEALRDVIGRDEGGGARAVMESATAGVGAGAAAACITQPLDCAKTRLQVGATPAEANLFQVLRGVYANEGMHALMRGAGARALWLAPGCGITISVFEIVSKALDRRRTAKPPW